MIFGDNTISYRKVGDRLAAKHQYEVKFNFDLPLLATGAYTIGVAIGEGTQQEHTQHHWIHDALAFKAEANPDMTGIIELENVQITFNDQTKPVSISDL